MNGSLRSLQIFTGILKRSKLGASEVFGVAEPQHQLWDTRHARERPLAFVQSAFRVPHFM